MEPQPLLSGRQVQPPHDVDLPPDLQQVLVVQLVLVDDFDGNRGLGDPMYAQSDHGKVSFTWGKKNSK